MLLRVGSHFEMKRDKESKNENYAQNNEALMET